MDPQIKQQFLLRLHQQQQRHRAPNHSYQSQQPHPNHHHSGGGGVGAPHPSSQQPPNNAVLQNHQQRVPQVCITTAEQNDSQVSSPIRSMLIPFKSPYPAWPLILTYSTLLSSDIWSRLEFSILGTCNWFDIMAIISLFLSSGHIFS